MTNKFAFEALARTLWDIMQIEKLFGGKVIVFGDDFRQILPVVPYGFVQILFQLAYPVLHY